MKGAKKFAEIFETGQYGQLYITSGSHARGNTFRIQILPKNEKAIPNGSQNMCLNKNAVEVYGVVSGNTGWTEEYGWLHNGKWQEDFAVLLKQKELEISEKENLKKAEILKWETKEKERINSLLNNY